MLHKAQVSPETKQPILKKRQKLTDGFTEDEARPLFIGKRRRLQHLDINVGSLDLTQTEHSSQQRQGKSSPGTETQPQTRTTASLWRARQYFSASQFKLESQDPVEASEVKVAPAKGHKIELDNFGPIVIPRTDSPRPENSGKMASSSVSPGELVQDSSPRMDLLPKPNTNGETRRTEPLALRPGPPCRLKSGFVVPDTPLQGRDTSQ